MTTSLDSQSAVSPVVAVILLVAVTVALSAVVGGFALNLGQSATSDDSTASAGVKVTQGTTSNGTSTLEITVVQADEPVKYRVNGSAHTLGGTGESKTLIEGQDYQAGDTVTILTGDGSSVVQSIQTDSNSQTETIAGPAPYAHWKFDDDSNTSVAIDSEGSLDAGLYEPSYVSGQDGNALTFNGSGDYAHRNESLFPSSHSNITISAWINADTYSTTIREILRTGSLFFRANHPYQSTDLELILCDTASSCHRVKIGKNVLNTNQWYFAVARYNGSSMSIEVYNTNDTVVASNSTTGSFTNRGSTEDIQIGGKTVGGGGEFWDGQLDDLRVYDQYLNDSEVKEVYNATK